MDAVPVAAESAAALEATQQEAEAVLSSVREEAKTTEAELQATVPATLPYNHTQETFTQMFDGAQTVLL